MIRRVYICDSCDYAFEVYQELHDEKRLKRCPCCKKHKLYQDLTGQHTFVYGEPKTIEHQADRNSKEMGKYHLQEKTAKDRAEIDKRKLDYMKQQGMVSQNTESLKDLNKTWYNPEGKNLKKELSEVTKNKKKARKYILEGKK